MNNIRLPETLGPLKQAREETFQTVANRAILKAARLMGTAGATHLAAFRGRDGGFEDLASRLQEAEIKQNIAWVIIGLLKVVPPLTFKDFETRTAIALYYYIHFRPQRAASPWGTPASAAPCPDLLRRQTGCHDCSTSRS